MSKYLLEAKDVLEKGNAAEINDFLDPTEVRDFFFNIRRDPGYTIIQENVKTFLDILEVVGRRSDDLKQSMELYRSMEPIIEDMKQGYHTLLKENDDDDSMWTTTFSIYKIVLESSSPILINNFYNVLKETESSTWKRLTVDEQLEFYRILHRNLPLVVDKKQAKKAKGNKLGERWNFLLYDVFRKILGSCDPQSIDSRIQAQTIQILDCAVERIIELKLQDESPYHDMFDYVAPNLCYENKSLCAGLGQIFQKIKRAELPPDSSLVNAANQCLKMIVDNGGVIPADPANVQVDIDVFLKRYEVDQLSATPDMLLRNYAQNPEVIHKNLPALLSHSVKMPLQHSIKIARLTQMVAASHPQVITGTMLNSIYAWLEDVKMVRLGLDTLYIIHRSCPSSLDISQLTRFASMNTFYTETVCSMLTRIACDQSSSQNESKVKTILEWLLGQCELEEDISKRKTLLITVKDIGSRYKELLAHYKKRVENLGTDEPILRAIATEIVDYLEGRSLINVYKKIEEAMIDIERVERKADNRTPPWCKQVAELITKAEDWTLMAKKLNFDYESLKSHGTHDNPCLSVLAEFYATHNTSEATRAVHIVLKSMDKEEAAAIVANALEKAGEMVPIDEPLNINDPPTVFISYQWGIQDKAKQLKDYLTDAGFSCWLDIGQMGGGDKLYEKIDNGIRLAKVVVNLVTDKYAKSPNCNKEVNLSATVKKPMFPLVMERMGWPPEGGMGPLFAEYVFIRFYQRPGEESKKGNFWPEASMEQLLNKLRNFLHPSVKGPTKDGKKDKTGSSAISANDSNEQQKEQPDVFISYNWDHKKEVKELYEKLTSLKFSCWLDEKQMGGGDTLFDKIDKGVRGCKVVLSCVTKKYAGSQNCQREVSLATGLKKEIIPLQLEPDAMHPEGPVGAALANLKYIDCTKSLVEGDSFNSLLSRLYQLKIPHGNPDGNSGSSTTTAPKSSTTKNNTPGGNESKACSIL